MVSRSNIESEGIWERRDRLNAQAAQRQDTWVEQMAVDVTKGKVGLKTRSFSKSVLAGILLFLAILRDLQYP